MEKFIIPHRDKIYRFVLRMVGNEFDAEDVMQDLAIKIWKYRDKFEELDNREAWSMTVARNLAIDKIRNRNKRRHINIEEAYDLSDENRDPYESLVSRDTMQVLKKWMDQLPENQRAPLHLREIEGMTYREIADICDMSLEQVKSNIFRGRRALKELLENSILRKKSLAN
jgi:RNA polymerase sigma-70 factor (ECF subfamily)